MQKVILILFSLIFVFTLSAQESGMGVGVILGQPTGISAKVWLDENSAFDIGLSYSFLSSGFNIGLHGDYLRHFNFPSETGIPIKWYAGVGGFFSTGGNDASFGFRIPFGVDWFLKEVPIDLFFEIVPGIILFPSTTLYFAAGLGVRWYFEKK